MVKKNSAVQPNWAAHIQGIGMPWIKISCSPCPDRFAECLSTFGCTVIGWYRDPWLWSSLKFMFDKSATLSPTIYVRKLASATVVPGAA